jgi:hypothetical protein
MQFKTWQQMFDYGWAIDGIDMEEIYQHFKARLIDEGIPEYLVDPDDWVMHVGKNKEV